MQNVSEGNNGVGYCVWRREKGLDVSVQGIINGHRTRRMHKVPSAAESSEGGMEYMEESDGADSNLKTAA